eukprot:UN02148
MPIKYILIISIGLMSTVYPIWFIRQQLLSNELYLSFQDTPHKSDYVRSSKAMEIVISDYQSFIHIYAIFGDLILHRKPFIFGRIGRD